MCILLTFKWNFFFKSLVIKAYKIISKLYLRPDQHPNKNWNEISLNLDALTNETNKGFK